MRSWGRRWRRGRSGPGLPPPGGRARAAGTGGCLGERSPHPARPREARGRNGSPVGQTPSWVTGAAASAEGLEQERLWWVFVRCLHRCRGRTDRPAHPSAEASPSWELAPSFCTATSGVFPEVARKLRHCGTDSPRQGRTHCWKRRPAGGRREHQEKGRNSASGSTGFPEVEERCEAFMQDQNSSHCSKLSQTTSLWCSRAWARSSSSRSLYIPAVWRLSSLAVPYRYHCLQPQPCLQQPQDTWKPVQTLKNRSTPP
ncbi:uncharacterized protein LOC128936439 [Melozone crissalis]|uniref:uncharacterized protein LOC128936439 n=1 Tax=Melozone crissalis TaxID=40204 RepID=UPI0023DC9B11|nr:uncharacterized protein LOC128936439 [Melozone crissalis]